MRLLALLVAASLVVACSDEDPPATGGWSPGTVVGSARTPVREFIDVRGVIHAHSVYSHDACDGEPTVGGERNAPCLAQMRAGMCASGHDFVMLTDHPDSFEASPFPDVLLYDAAAGDRLVERDGGPVASRLACPSRGDITILAGFENSTGMAVGLEGHAPDTSAYHAATTEAVTALKAQGAVMLMAHTEERSMAELVDLPIDGFEMFNLHANTLRHITEGLELIVLLDAGGAGLPHPDLVLLPFIDEDPVYLSRWSRALDTGARRVTVLATDVHQNSFPGLLGDGERIDGYRRMMVAFSNHLLIRPEADGSWDDRHLKEALRAGRAYGAFEILGYPIGFDFAARDGSGVVLAEMGDEVDLAAAPRLSVTPPRLVGADPKGPAPRITTRLLVASDSGWQQIVPETEEPIEYVPTEAGAYRAEVRMRPRHLADHLGEFAERLVDASHVWIYGNPIYVR